jgi:diadenylate cyclase
VEVLWAFQNLTPLALLDIFLVALLIFSVSFLFRGTQSRALLRGTILVLITVLVVSRLFQLLALRWLFESIITILAVAIPVIFQPELRRALEGLGRAGLPFSRQAPENMRAQIIDSICQASEKLSERRHGALIVLQRTSNLEDYIRTGIILNSDVSSQLLLTIFWPKTELHDGAAIIDARGHIASAASVLPLTASRNLPGRKLGTRHRAALGISEVSDAICVVVSEETGRISITHGGRMITKLDVTRLRTVMLSLYGAEPAAPAPRWARLVNRVQGVFRQEPAE